MYRFSRPTCYVFLLHRAASPCRDVDLELFHLAVDAAGAVLARVHEVDVAEDERLGDVAAFRRGPVHLQLRFLGVPLPIKRFCGKNKPKNFVYVFFVENYDLYFRGKKNPLTQFSFRMQTWIWSFFPN